MIIVDHGHEFRISFGYDNYFKNKVADIKSIPEYKWMYNEKYWRIPSKYEMEVKQLGAKYRAQIIHADQMAPETTGDITPLPELDMTIGLFAALKGTLMHYQEQGVARGVDLKKFINGDEPGLGKTFQAIATLVAAELKGEEVFPALVVCPSTIKINWVREWEKFSNKKAMVLSDKTLNTWHIYWNTGVCQVFIVNYESLKKFFVQSMPKKGKESKSKDIIMKPNINLFKSVIIDELHRCKDPSTLQSKLCIRIGLGKNYRIGLTGTPVKNKPADLWPQLAIIGQLHRFGDKKQFLERYCEDGRGANNLRELNYLLNQYCFFRREKKDVLKDLPEKQRQTILCEITTRPEYERVKQDLLTWLRQNGFTNGQINKKMKGEALVKMNALRKISAKGKINEVREFAQEIIDAGEKLVLFCNLHEIVDEVKKIFPSAVTITGKDTMESRQRHIDAFQADPKTQLIICNIQAAGVGLTLTSSSRVAFIEFPWTYADSVQCEDRCHRKGQTNNVMCTYFLGQNTIDERVFELIMEKKDIANTITGGTDEMEMAIVDRISTLFNEL